MKTLRLLGFLLLSLSLFTFVACDDDDEMEVENEEEVITTLTFTLTPDGGGTPIILTFNDPDGEGGNNGTTTVSGPFAANTTYTGAITLLNETETPAENVTLEIQEEDDEHQFFFEISSGVNLTVAYSDTDDDNNPVGLVTEVTAGDASTGTMKVTLRHEPAKDAAGVSTGDITNAGGETDIEVTFDVEIQ